MPYKPKDKRRYLIAEHIQARLNPDQPNERRALEIFYHYFDQGKSPREVITWALLALAEEQAQPQEGPNAGAIMAALEAMRESLVDALSDVLDSKLDELARLSPRDRKAQVREAAQSSFKRSVLDAVDVRDYEEGES